MTDDRPASSLGALARRPAFVAAAAAMAAAGAAAGALPVLEVPGYELGMAGCFLAAVLGAPLGIAAARRHASPTAAFAAASAILLALLAALFAGSALRAALASRCSTLATAAWYPLLAGPSALLGCALGVACARAARGRRAVATALYVLVALTSLAAAVAAMLRGPAAYALDPLLGAWPGPLYDEALPIDARVLLARAGAVALAAAIAAGTELAVRLARRAWGPAGPAAVLALSVGALVAAAAASRAGGWTATRADIARALGGHRTGPRCDLVYPEEKPPAEAERLARDCEFDAAAVAGALGVERPPRVTVYVYRSDDEKRRLVGAGRTDFTKPWLLEVHVTDAPAPHPLLRHELVHAISASFARGPLRMPARAGVLVSAGLVEGLAMAVDLPRGEWTVHEWARAMRDLGLMPPISALVGPAGFFGTAPARAYAVAGSFLRFLIDRHGTAPVRAAYRDGDFAAAFGAPLSSLEAEWQRFLDGVPVPPPLAAAAEARFRKGSLFARRCAREVALLEWRAAREAGRGRGPEAAALYGRAAAASGDPTDLRDAGDALRRSGEVAAAERAYLAALDSPGGADALREAIEAALGDVCWSRGDRAGAAERYRRALALHPDRGEARALRAKLAALADPALESAAAPWLLREGDDGAALARLARASAPLARYLAGRAFLSRGAPRLALATLARASADLPDPSFEEEAQRLVADASCRTGRFDDGIARFAAIARAAPREADRLRAADDAARCAFEREKYGGAVRMPGDGP